MCAFSLLIRVVTSIFEPCLLDLQSVCILLILKSSSLLISPGFRIHFVLAFMVAVIVLFCLSSLRLELVELTMSVNHEIVYQNAIKSNDIPLYFGQPFLVNIAFEPVRVTILLEHFEVSLGKSGRNSLEMRDVLVDLHHKFTLFICFHLFINSGVFGQDLLMQSACCRGHYGIMISWV